MYIAQKKYRGRNRYLLRETFSKGERLTFRNLFDFGCDPSIFIEYSGGNAFYFSDKIEDAILKVKPDYDPDELEELLWPWIKPDIRRAVETFKNRSSKKEYKKLSEKEREEIAEKVHCFDKRRSHYLRFGSMDLGPVENMPAALFKNLVNKSRDEIENHFIREESVLKIHELKSYVYATFNLHSFFAGFMSKKMPHALDQEKVDTCFLKEMCRLNKDLFNKETHLDEYMIRYSIMFFDNQYAHTTLLDDFAEAFMNRHRFFKSKPQTSVTAVRACEIFKITEKDIRSMTRKQLTKHYRRLARDLHPDAGGSHEKFVELNNAYQNLLLKI